MARGIRLRSELVLSFVVLTPRNGAELDMAEVDRIAASSSQLLPFEPATHVRWIGSGGRVAVLAWALHPLDLPVGPRWWVDEEGLTAFGGYVFPANGPWGPGSWARQLGALFRECLTGPSTGSCWGVFTAVHVDASGTGIVCADPLAVGLLYRASSSSFDVVANRADLAAEATGRHGDRDLEGVGWLIAYDSILDDRTSFSGVTTVQAGRGVRVDAGGNLTEIDVNSARWPLTELDYPDALATLSSDLQGHLATVASLGRPVRLGLTGGRDSRLVLAFALSAGVTGALEFFTAQSFPDSRDVDIDVATMIAEQFALRHRIQVDNRRTWSSDQVESRVRVHASTTTGMLGAVNLRVGLLLRPHTQISGAFGELLSGFRAGDAPPATLSEAKAALADRVLGGRSGGLLRADAREHYRSVVERLVEVIADQVAEPADIPYRFYLDHRAHNWMGRELEVPGVNPNMEPLYSVAAPIAARAAGWHGRRNLRLHFDLIRTVAPTLAELPFASKGWSDALLAGVDDADRYRRPPILGTSEPRTVRGLSWEDHRELFARHLLDDSACPITAVIDRDAVEDVLAGRRPMPPGGVVQLFNALGAAVWLARREQPDRLSRQLLQRVP